MEQKQQKESFRKPSCLTSRFEPEDLMVFYINYQLIINQIIDIFNKKIKLLGDPASWQPLTRLEVVDSIYKGLYLFIQVVYCLCTLYNVQYLCIFV